MPPGKPWPLLQLPGNTTGRDFVVGDLHGCLDLLQEQLARVNFQPRLDRLFSVGDLIDRGGDSMGCLRLLREPWFFAVLGNHEAMLLEHFGRPPSTGSQSSILSNGGGWLTGLGARDTAELRGELLDLVAALPYVIQVGGPTAFNVAHAEIVSWPGAAYPFTDREIVPERLLTMLQPLVWGRRLVQEFSTAIGTPSPPAGLHHCAMPATWVTDTPHHPGLTLTFVGHTPLRYPALHRSHLFIDRGAFMRDEDSELLLLDVRQALTFAEAY